uniref:Caspase-8 n=1 Tax=Acropora millepora TaxID=45264 RepID=A0A0B5KPL7_ACRMI|nr:caspase 8 [Acropora millepora]
MTMAEGELNSMLFILSNGMRTHDLQNLKHLCHGKIPLGDLEKAQSARDVFRIMRQKLLIRPGKLDLLESMLKQIGRADLAKKLQSGGGADTTMESEGALRRNSLEGNNREFLMTLSDELTKENVESLKFIADLPYGVEERIQNGRDFFKYLQQAGNVGPNLLSHLEDFFGKIHRMDLAMKVREYQDQQMGVNTINTNKIGVAPVGNMIPRPCPAVSPVTGKQPTMHQMSDVKSPTMVLLSPADFSKPPQPSEPSEPRYPVQAEPNVTELLDPLQRIGMDQEDAMPSYPMNQRPRGIALIIGNEHFGGNPSLRDRQGNKKDIEHLQELWSFLNFQVEIRRDLNSQDIYNVMREISTLDHSQFDCFVCCLLSHGAHGGIYGTDSELVEIKDITALFKGVACPSLYNKPKLFFIQACRGQGFDRGARMQADATEVSPEDALRHNAEPNESHFLLGYATPPGYVSWRSQIHGSWYISKLCEVFRKYCERYDVTSMMVRVNDEVSEAFTKMGYKQCPAPVVTLRKRIYFNNN